MQLLTSWGLQVELGEHVFDQWGYMAGRDEDRVADLNAAFRDPGVRAVFASRGGKGAYRIVDALDFDAVRRDPKPVVGFSDVTHVHLALWARCRSGSLEGLRAVVVGQFIGFEVDTNDRSLGGWGIVDVLRDRLTRLGVPVLGGLPAGHDRHPPTIPLGTRATIDTVAGTLTVEPAVY